MYILEHPIIHDEYFETNFQTKDGDGLILPITVTCCPYSLTGIVYFGHYLLSGETFNNNIVLKRDNDENNDKMIQLTGQIYDGTTGHLKDTTIRKSEVKIMILRDAISIFPDCSYLQSDNSPKSEINSKALVYGIEYLSSSDSESKDKKYSVIINKNVSGFEFKKSGYYKYINEMHDKLKDKGAILIPCLWSVWHAFYPDSKVIELNKT